ncbi:hypothetical protein PILCRDRAFT_818010 [Piloderma croceum F 1598]|uniref:Uncharacterized protein n=1 Tax=Piloderma croceum (strain F 1598) TaxID=765440 RepID=A0A0C3FXX5_PILCF|nr:hypothetical protein PILCRDRAFT_818010 [Piloderma croceum F 1598]
MATTQSLPSISVLNAQFICLSETPRLVLASNGTFRSCVNDGPISDGMGCTNIYRENIWLDQKTRSRRCFQLWVRKRLRVDAHPVEAGVRSRSSSVHSPKENLDQRRLHDHRKPFASCQDKKTGI